MKRINLLLYFFVLQCCNSVSAQFIDFETAIPASFRCINKQELSLSKQYYKEGVQSLEWNFHPGSSIQVNLDNPLQLNNQTEEKYGITLWIYNEMAQPDSIRFEFLSPQGNISYWFTYRLVAPGWRACWIGFQNMKGDKFHKEIASYRIVAPNRKGRVFLDRLTFPMKEINLRTTPDQQMPYNNSLSYRDLWHWCRVWQWEQYKYDIPFPSQLTPQQKEELKAVEQRLTTSLDIHKAPTGAIKKAYEVFKAAQIQSEGSGFKGAPVVAPDELDRSKGELSWNDLETMLAGFAYDAYYNHSNTSLKNYFTVWDYAIDQGFAYGSGMGTNHHYGYQVRNIYTTAWLMRDAIWKSANRNNILSTLAFWSALQETRQSCQYGRDELLDSWHTLLMAKTISALLFVDERERVQALHGLSRWISTSLQYTPGTIGGIKLDGTTFHHGGFYPAYTTGVLAMIGNFISLTTQTEYELTEEARQILKSAFIAMRNYSNKYEWGIGIGGRHPFGGTMKSDDVAAFASLALSGDLSGERNAFDHQLAADYLRLCGENTPEAHYFKEQGIKPAKSPQGFFVYNYGSAGIFRKNDWMVTLKGYTTDVWGSEIYQKDNRYGRYQSYGSVQIMGRPTRIASGYNENGWNWNRLPGTTTIHLPYELLDSPLPGTTMAHSKENFSGSSSLEGKNGMFAIKLMERELKNFTPDFVARKSVFCFENRMICIGTGINNSNMNYPTETTLFQSTFEEGKSALFINGQKEDKLGFQKELNTNSMKNISIKDNQDNYYFVKDGEVHIQITNQESRHEKTRAVTHGDFASAWINHGKAPKNGIYEYLVWIQPTDNELQNQQALQTYDVLQRNDSAHIVHDRVTGITAYAVFETYQAKGNDLINFIPAETMVMYRKDKDNIIVSVCDPNLNIEEKAYTTKEPSRIIKKTLVLEGIWRLSNPSTNIESAIDSNRTMITINCQHGQPVEFVLQKN